MLFATLGVGLLVSLLLSRTLARPLTQMSRAAAQIAAGNLDHPLTLDSPDELGDLARALNRMARDLRAHEEALRAERSELEAKNAELERFTYTVSHDLKSPLVTIRGFLALVERDARGGQPRARCATTSAASATPPTRCTACSTTCSSCRGSGAS